MTGECQVSPDLVTVDERLPGVVKLQLNLEKRLNVLSIELLTALHAALERAAKDQKVKVVILSGVGRSFSAGGDLSQFRDDLEGAPRTAERMVSQFHRCVHLMQEMPKPIIGALQGPVAGGGFSLALACDLGIAAEGTTFVSAYSRLGINPDGGGSWQLVRFLGRRRALEVLLLNETLSAERAYELGFVNRVVAASDLDAEVEKIATRLAKESFRATASIKSLVRLANVSSLEEQLDREQRYFVEGAGTSDFKEGITAFFERRSPCFE